MIDEPDEYELPWPETGHKLFAPRDDGWHSACLNYLGCDEPASIEGYYLGANRLVAYVQQTQRDQDFLVYPITFLYRHFLELSFKRIRRMGFRLLHWEYEVKADHRRSSCFGTTAGRPSEKSGLGMLTARTCWRSIAAFVSSLGWIRMGLPFGIRWP